jgi:LSD1 subclass zinc finger protein
MHPSGLDFAPNPAEEEGSGDGMTEPSSELRIAEAEAEPTAASPLALDCPACGADLLFQPGAEHLRCAHCGLEEAVEPLPGSVVTGRDLAAVLSRHAEGRCEEESDALPGSLEVFCPGCGATVCFEGSLTSTRCDHCGGALERDEIYTSEGRLPVDGMLPFAVERDAAHRALAAWARSRWFAPRGLARRAAEGRFSGVYVPCFLFSALAAIRYTGDRGEAYVFESGSGASRRSERRLHWTAVSASFQSVFEDVPVVPLESLPPALLRALEPWPLEKLVPFSPGLLAGLRAHTYEISLREAFARARSRMNTEIDAAVRRRIGGNAQHVLAIETHWVAGRYQHLLLPLWVLVYRVRGRPYRALVNGVTGEVSGERPWSTTKLLLASALALALAGALALLA